MANQFYVEPAQFGPGLSALAGSVNQFGQQRKAEQATQEQKAYEQAAKQAMAEAFQSGDPGAIRSAVIQFPEIAETAKQMFGFTNDQTEQVARETYRMALSETDPRKQAAIMEGGIETVSQFGGNPRMMTQDLARLRENPEAFNRSARGGYAALASDQEFEAMFPELSAGAVSPANVREYQYFQSLSEPEQRQYLNMKRASQTFRQGDVEMLQDPVQPEQAAPITEKGGQPTTQAEAQQVATEQQATKAATEAAAKQAIKMSGEAREKLSAVRSSIPQYDRAIELVEEEGVRTGPLARRFPSLTASAVELDNIQSQLGLNVISSVTFGALSKGELDLALETALPTGLEGKELADWLRRKRDAQKKLANYLEEAAIFLGEPGNLPADWMKKQRDKRQGGGSQEETVSWDDL